MKPPLQPVLKTIYRTRVHWAGQSPGRTNIDIDTCPVIAENEWLWTIQWHGNGGYIGVIYKDDPQAHSDLESARQQAIEILEVVIKTTERDDEREAAIAQATKHRDKWKLNAT